MSNELFTKSRERQDSSPKSNEGPDLSPKSSETKDTSPKSSAGQVTSPKSSERKETSPEGSEGQVTSAKGSKIPDTSPKSSERKDTSPKGSEEPDASPKSSVKAGNASDGDDAQGNSPQADRSFPKSVFFILGNEFCERYSFYGLRTILYLFSTDQLQMSNDSAAAIFHTFTMMAYFFPIPGAIIADSWMGRFQTILWLSIVYAIGCVVLAVGSIPNSLTVMTSLSMLGLFTIAAGTGGIKPCVSAFGGNQFAEGQEKQQQTFFSMFYFVINCGSILSTITTPLLRSDVHCLGELTCYPLAFGVPATLMFIAIVIFVAGKPLYVIHSLENNLIPRVCKCVCYAAGKRLARRGEKRKHWLDHADDKFDQGLIDDTKRLLRILKLYLPLPIFWALFDQQGSRWTQQAKQLDGNFFNLFQIKPDQMQTLNPIFVIIFIPIFVNGVYPILDKLKLLRTPLQRITAGGIIASLAFVLAGCLQLAIDSPDANSPSALGSELVLINNSPCRIRIQQYNRTVQPFSDARLKGLPTNSSQTMQFFPEACNASAPYDATINFNSIMLSYMIALDNGNIVGLESSEDRTFLTDDTVAVKIYFALDIEDARNATFKLLGKRDTYYVSLTSGTNRGRYGMTAYQTVAPATYAIHLPRNSTSHYDQPVSSAMFEEGHKYILSVHSASGSAEAATAEVFEMTPSQPISILYMIPQYLTLTAAEILLSITGLEFSYTQAPESMKSVVQAAWLATTAIGNLLVAVISESKAFSQLSSELFFYAALMASVMVVFAILAYFYEYINPEEYEGRKGPTRKSLTPRAAPRL